MEVGGVCQGIIPAGTGSTTHWNTIRRVARDHPRGYGEHNVAVNSVGQAVGSSPRVRGAPCTRLERSRCSGIIPAGTGSTYPVFTVNGSFGDHPRGYGEHGEGGRFGLPSTGSSPRVRGAPWRQACCPASTGIIPAGTGSTGLAPGIWLHGRDHPRGYGEHSSESVT